MAVPGFDSGVDRASKADVRGIITERPALRPGLTAAAESPNSILDPVFAAPIQKAELIRCRRESILCSSAYGIPFGEIPCFFPYDQGIRDTIEP